MLKRIFKQKSCDAAYTTREATRRMITACNRHRWHIAQSLLDIYGPKLVNIYGVGNSNSTPLHSAAAAGQTNFLMSLLDHGADVEVPTIEGCTPLYIAVRNNRSNSVRILLHAGANVDAQCGGCTPLLTATDKGYSVIVSLLLDAGANVHFCNDTGDQALHIAARHGYITIAKALFENGADLHVIGSRGLTPADVAQEAGHYDLAQFLRVGSIEANMEFPENYGMMVPYNSDLYLNRSGFPSEFDCSRTADALVDFPHRPKYLTNGQNFDNYNNCNFSSPFSYIDNEQRYQGRKFCGTSSNVLMPYSGVGPNHNIEMEGQFRYGAPYGYGPGMYDQYGEYGDYGGYGYDGYRQGYFSTRRSEQVAQLVSDFIGHGMSYSERRRFLRRIERNSRLYGITPNSVFYGRHDSESLARMLVTDTGGYCRHDDFYAMVDFLRTMRRRAVFDFV